MYRRSKETGPVPVVSATADGTAGAGGVTLQLMTNWTVSRGAGTSVGQSGHAVAAAPSGSTPDVRHRDQTPRGATAAAGLNTVALLTAQRVARSATAA